MKTKKPFPSLVALAVLLLLAWSCGGDGFEIVGPLDETEDGPDILTGSVKLENVENHSAVRVELVDIQTSLLTGADGEFTLPENLAEGEWTIRASYPYFTPDDQKFVVQNGTPSQSLDAMELPQRVRFSVHTDKENYVIGETVEIRLFSHNVTEEALTLSSPTSPISAVAVRKDGETILGGLLPGSDEVPESVVLEPGDVDQRTFYWPLDNAELGAGELEIYAVLTDGDNFPDYFTANTATVQQFNESLFSKLDPAVITIE